MNAWMKKGAITVQSRRLWNASVCCFHSTIPEELPGREMVYHVDNTAVGVGWHKGYVKNDATATIFLRCIHSIAMLLGTMIHVVHVKRMSNDMAALADKLSRTDKWDRDEKILLKGKEVKMKSQALLRWLKHPVEDWNLPQNDCGRDRLQNT